MTCPFMLECGKYQSDGEVCNSSSRANLEFCGRYRTLRSYGEENITYLDNALMGFLIFLLSLIVVIVLFNIR